MKSTTEQQLPWLFSSESPRAGMATASACHIVLAGLLASPHFAKCCAEASASYSAAGRAEKWIFVSGVPW